MTLPNQLTTGFVFDEAIALAEFAAQARQVFARTTGEEAKALYNLLFKDDEWGCVHALGAHQVHALLLQRKEESQFALVIDVTPATSQASPATATVAAPAEHASQMITVTNIPGSRASHQQQPTVSDDSVEYLPMAGERTPPLRGARVYHLWQRAFAAIQAQLEAAFSPTGALQLHNGFSLYVAGHGAGGCVAALTTLHLQRIWEAQLDFPTFQLKTYTFGSPKIGNRAFVDGYNQRMQGFSYRVQNLMDGATYAPMPQAPFPYNLQALLPGVDYVRQGNHYFTTYEHVGELCALPGMGRLPQNYNFAQGFKALTALPFAHDAAGYHAMLSEAQSLQSAVLGPAQQATAWLNSQTAQLLGTFQQQVATLQSAAAKFQGKNSV